ncbi:MAG: hypothetical protein A2516_01040 [Alphaproteobacteria bacterium RIFOXYD12_FULL_60_8]|nr:MAG: hypothetical protein A2516_01040 [Alphaproteobacteria bacterium RIFOXYD12_FULL_60_8]
MKHSEIARVQAYLRQTLGNNKIKVIPPKKSGSPIEVTVNDEFLGVLHRDEDEGEVSFSLMITILDIDLPELD